LGGDNDLMSQARAGAIEFCQPTGQILASILPVTAISALGFAWSDYSKVWPAMDGDLGKFVRAQISAKAGLVAMDRMWDLGFRQITTSTKPIKTADDLVGLKIRVPVAPSLVTLFKTLKAAPLSMQFTEVYSALQTHIADAQENPLTLIKVTKLFEVQKYCSLTNHVWDGHWMCCNAAAWKGLPDDLKEIVARNLNAAALRERDDIAKGDRSVQADLEKAGLAFNTAETQSFRDGLKSGGFYKDWRAKLGDEPWAILEKYAGTLG
jgi:tripartite ATP-independent transporter DctP family solute receptor